MNPPVLPIDTNALEPRLLIWPLLFGLGAYLLLTAQPIGRPKSDLAERLRRLDVEERIRAEIIGRGTRPIFASTLLEGMLRPVLDDLGRLLRTVLERFGLGGGRELERKLGIARSGVEPVQFLGEKVASALVGLGVVPSHERPRHSPLRSLAPPGSGCSAPRPDSWRPTGSWSVGSRIGGLRR